MPSWTVSKQFKFEAAHKLPHHDGKCRRLHGHSWVGYLKVAGYGLTPQGAKQSMVVDFGDLKAIVAPLVEDYLDHHYLNETLEMESPTSERIAQWVAAKVAPLLPSNVALVSVVIEETCTSRCEYQP